MRLQKTHISLSLADLKSNLEYKWKKGKLIKAIQGVKCILWYVCKKRRGTKINLSLWESLSPSGGLKTGT